MGKDMVTYEDKFNKLMSFYYSLSDLYFELARLHYQNIRNTNGHKKLINNIRLTVDFINEYINENISIEDAILIMDYIDDDNINTDGIIYENVEFLTIKIYNVLKNMLDFNIEYNKDLVTCEKVEDYIKASEEHGNYRVANLPGEELVKRASETYSEEISKEAEDLIETSIEYKASHDDISFSFLKYLLREIKREKNDIIKPYLIKTFYDAIMSNSEVEKFMIFNNYCYKGFVCSFDLYNRNSKIRKNTFKTEAKQKMDFLLSFSDKKLSSVEEKINFIICKANFKGVLSLMDFTDIVLLRANMFHAIRKKKEEGEYSNYSIAVRTLLSCFRVIEQEKRKAIDINKEENKNLERVKKIIDNNK